MYVLYDKIFQKKPKNQPKNKKKSTDLSITRIAGLTWNEWNARLAMPLVTQLSEGVQPLVFPTDLSLNALEKQASNTNTSTTTSTTIEHHKITSPTIITKEKCPLAQNLLNKTNTINSSNNNSGTTTPHKIKALPVDELIDKRIITTTPTSSSGTIGTISSSTIGNCSKLNHLSEEEATALMLKAAAEKAAIAAAAAAAANNSGNLSDTSYSEDNNSSAVADFHATASTLSLSNINILSNISAMNSLIGVNASSLGNASIASSSNATNNNNNSNVSGSGGSGSGGHPCPDCGRVYKLKSSLRNHQKWECGKEPQFQCPFCVYRAKQKMHIGRHMERMHKEKFKLEDLKSFTNAGGNASGTSGAGSDDSALNDLRQHFQ